VHEGALDKAKPSLLCYDTYLARKRLSAGGFVLNTSTEVRPAIEVMTGNHAIARGLFEAGLDLAAAYPGTPSSEILPGIIRFSDKENRRVYTEWSTNERCAFEVAFGAALMGKQAACVMKQVGLNVAFPPLLKGRNKAIKGALVIISCDDPGPQSSQTEQDTRLLAALFGIPVFDPASPGEAADVAYYALRYSFEQKKPVIIRSTHRVSHAREAVPVYPEGQRNVVLNEGVLAGTGRKLGIVASGMSCSLALDVLGQLGGQDHVSLYKAVRVLPPDPGLFDFAETAGKVLVIEETDAVLEALLDGGDKVLGRRNGYVPGQGELTYDIVRDVIERALKDSGIAGAGSHGFEPDSSIATALEGVTYPERPPKLCAGCPHRASFYAMKQAFPDAVFPGDIGCYTLGISMGAVDTCLDMGGAVSLASGFYDTFQQDGRLFPIIASVGDSTFFHACLTPLYDAVLKEKRFILVIMDNSTTAMTGMQPTPGSGLTAAGGPARPISIEDVVRSFGIEFMRVLDPYDVPLFTAAVKEAYAYLDQGGRAPAVIIARRECVLSGKGGRIGGFDPAAFEDACIGCGSCVEDFGCPGLVFDNEARRIKIDEGLCVRCGTCLYACPVQSGA
jgi:indolepyruvate ferredoxin oxidoreductase, alpha subunit